jgi:hypothetical protein
MNQILRTELLTDPLSRGYARMTDTQVADSLNTVNRSIHKATMTGSEILQNINVTEYIALTDAKKTQLWGLLGIGTLDPWGKEADVMIGIFGAGAVTITALGAARVTAVSRAQELGITTVLAHDVAYARA